MNSGSSMNGSSMNSGSSVSGRSAGTSSPSTLNEPVNDTRPGGNERQTAPRTPLTDPGEQNNGSGTTPGAQSRNNDQQSFAQALDNNAEFSTLATAIKAAGLDTTLASGGPFTIFAPTNEAFAAIPPETLRQLLLPENRQVLRQILTYHVVQADLPSSAIKPGSVNTVEGSPVAIAGESGSVTVAGANVVQPDIVTRNGVIHAIDQVLLPPSLQRKFFKDSTDRTLICRSREHHVPCFLVTGAPIQRSASPTATNFSISPNQLNTVGVQAGVMLRFYVTSTLEDSLFCYFQID
jgi:uncharacterized surface protein with fasciclin (FAS1) repeats